MSFPNDLPVAIQVIKEWTFRENGAIFLPKQDRERAHITKIEIEVISVANHRYRNYETTPASDYYGYATIVLGSFALPPIQIVQPRQVVYYSRLDNVIELWWDYFRAIEVAAKFEEIETLICAGIIPLLDGSCPPKSCIPIAPPSWIEDPLREVYVNSHFGTQFKITHSYWYYQDLLDNCGNLVSASSGQVDIPEDDGLPKEGSQPQNAQSPNNPYAGLEPPSTVDDSPLGLINQSSLSTLDGSNPANSPILGNNLCVGTVTSRTDDGNTVLGVSNISVELEAGEFLIIEQVPSTGGAQGVNTNGLADRIKSSTRELWYDGIGMSPVPSIWTFGTATIQLVCTPIAGG